MSCGTGSSASAAPSSRAPAKSVFDVKEINGKEPERPGQCRHCRLLEMRRARIGCKGEEGRERVRVPRVRQDEVACHVSYQLRRSSSCAGRRVGNDLTIWPDSKLFIPVRLCHSTLYSGHHENRHSPAHHLLRRPEDGRRTYPSLPPASGSSSWPSPITTRSPPTRKRSRKQSASKIYLVPGMELSTRDEGGNKDVHVVGLKVDVKLCPAAPGTGEARGRPDRGTEKAAWTG